MYILIQKYRVKLIFKSGLQEGTCLLKMPNNLSFLLAFANKGHFSHNH